MRAGGRLLPVVTQGALAADAIAAAVRQWLPQGQARGPQPPPSALVEWGGGCGEGLVAVAVARRSDWAA